MKTEILSFGSLNLRVSPFLLVNPRKRRADLLKSVNVMRDTVGAYKKRQGYTTYLGTVDNSPVTSLFSWRQNDDATFFTYRFSGGILYYSTAGTGAWTVCGNGTMTSGAVVGYTVLDNTMIVGDGTASSRHTTNGTSFTNTTNAPLASLWAQYQGRVWAARGTAVSGTNTDLFYSTTGTATDWTTDSSSIRIPGAGRVSNLFKANDRLVSTKDSGNMFRYDGFNLVDLATDLGPSSSYSVGSIEDYRLYLNRKGVFGYGGGKPELISNAIQRQIYNDPGSAIAGTTFANAIGVVHKYDYLLGVGTITDDLTNETISNAILKYDYQLNEWSNWTFANRPTAFHSYRDLNGNEQLIWGDANGQCYQLSGTALTDNGSAISSSLMGMIHGGAPELDKKWNYVWAITNPGCQAKIQVALADTFTKGKLRWIDLKQTRDGVMEAKMPEGSRSKLLFWKLYEASKESRWQLYEIVSDYEPIERK